MGVTVVVELMGAVRGRVGSRVGEGVGRSVTPAEMIRAPAEAATAVRFLMLAMVSPVPIVMVAPGGTTLLM